MFEKGAHENLSAFRETTPKHGYLGSEQVQNDEIERRTEIDERGEGKKTTRPYVFIFSTLEIHSQRITKTLTGPFFKPPGRCTCGTMCIPRMNKGVIIF